MSSREGHTASRSDTDEVELKTVSSLQGEIYNRSFMLCVRMITYMVHVAHWIEDSSSVSAKFAFLKTNGETLYSRRLLHLVRIR